MKFATITADPPWHYACWVAGGTRHPGMHYKTQDSNWIAGLGDAVQAVAAEDCVLLMWATFPQLPEALEVIAAWGFTFKTVAFTWVKLTKAGRPTMGLGYWTRSNAEIMILATKGAPKRIDKGVSQVVEWPDEVIACGLGRHSEKPLEIYDRVERLVEGPYLEMFARPYGGLLEDRTGWTRIGNEITGRDIREDLELLARREEA